jgi:hypothetical protein
MKFDPNSPIRSQRENMQPYQLRLPKETVRDLQILRVFASVKVSEEIRDLVVNYVRERRHLIQQAAATVIPPSGDNEFRDAIASLVDSGDAIASEHRTIGKVTVQVDADGKRSLVDHPLTDEDKEPRVAVRRRKD